MNNKKRLIAIIAGLTMSAASIAGLSACKKHQHSWKEEWTPSATEHWHDPACDDTTEVKDKGAHVWDDGTVVIEATHTTPGQKKYTCKTCGYEKTESIPASGHTYSDELGHNDNFHWKVPNCECENLTEAELKKDKAEHVLVPVVDEQPTDTKNGKQHYECSTEGCDYETAQKTLYNYIGDKVTVGNVEDDTTVIAEQNKDGNAWTGAVKLTKLNATSKTFVYDLHVSGKYAGSWVDAWAWQRFGIQVTENTGFYIWNNTNDGSKVCIRKFTADNKTNCEKECQEEVLVSGNAAEAAYGWITEAVCGEDGADLRITRVNDKLNLYVKNADGYQYIGTVTCGDEANEFALYGVTAEYTFSDFEVTALTHVEEKAPSATEKGYFEYYYTGADESKVYYDANGKLTAWDELERPAVLETVVITLQTKKDGQTAEFSGTTVKVDGEDITVTEGKITLENVEPNTEVVITAGDYTGKLKVTAPAESVVLEYNYATATGKVDLSQMNDEDHAITFPETNASSQSEWTGAVTIKLTDEEKASKAYIYDMNIKMSAYTGSWGDIWAWQRYAIQLTDTTGFYLWSAHNPWNTDITFVREFGTSSDKDNRVNAGAENAAVNANEAANGWIYRALISDGGANFRFIRVGEKITLYVHNGENYAEIGSVNCGDSANKIVLYAINTQYTFSDFNMTALTHVDEKAPSASEAGHFEHYYTGTGSDKVYYDANGKLTAWDKLERPAVLETVVITLQTKKDGQTAEFSGATVKVDGEDVAVTDGKITLTDVEPNTEVVITAGDYTGKLTITKAAESVVLEYNYATATGKVDLSQMNDTNHAITVNGAVADYSAGNWSGSAKVNIIGENADKDIVFEFTVKNVTNSQAGWPTDEWASQRFAIQAANGNRGFLFFEPNGECNVFDMTDNSLSDSNKTKLCQANWVGTQLRTESGAKFRVVRVGSKLVFSAMNAESKWQELGTIDCGEAENEIILYACGVTYEFSDFEVTALTHVEEKAPSATEAGYYEHYYTGTGSDKVYYDANGKLTTLEKLTLTTE